MNTCAILDEIASGITADFADEVRDAIILHEAVARTPMGKYRQILREKRKTYNRITREGIRQSRRFVREVQTRVSALLADAPAYEAAFLPQLRTAVEDSMEEFERKFISATSNNQKTGFELGTDSVDDALEARGIHAAMPSVPTSLLTTAQGFSADLIQDIGNTTLNRINQELSLGVMTGRSVPDVAKSVRGILSATPPKITGAGRQYSLKYRSELIARTELARIHSQAQLTRLEQAAEVIPDLKVEWIAEPDYCEQCEPYAGKIYEVDKVPVDIPVHPNCYSVDTEVLTAYGFKLFSDIKMGEKILALNPKNLELEYTPVINKTSYTSQEMIHFNSRNFDMLVTPDHNMLIAERKRPWTTPGVWKFIEAEKVKDESRIYRSGNWDGNTLTDFYIDDNPFPSNEFMSFLGFYLSEGSASRTPEVSLSQSKDKHPEVYDRMIEVIEGLGCKPYRSKNKISFRNKIIFDYVKELGKSHEKYIPLSIKLFSSKHLKLLLDAYILGDGHIKTGSNWKNGNFREERTYFTSSKRLADDIGELILKIGKRPSFKLRHDKGKKIKFRNGIYNTNHDLWIIRECYSQTSQVCDTGIKVEKIKKETEVACVEVQEHHTLYIRRNGKCAWSGNCKCDLVPYKEEWEKA